MGLKLNGHSPKITVYSQEMEPPSNKEDKVIHVEEKVDIVATETLSEAGESQQASESEAHQASELNSELSPKAAKALKSISTTLKDIKSGKKEIDGPAIAKLQKNIDIFEEELKNHSSEALSYIASQYCPALFKNSAIQNDMSLVTEALKTLERRRH